jgi:hypothetical protein
MSAVDVSWVGAGAVGSWPGIFGKVGSSMTIPTGETTPSSLRLRVGFAIAAMRRSLASCGSADLDLSDGSALAGVTER